ncbi:MAG: RluA family pseudouridine synthase [Thermoguttaceae bacterium]|jgi:23S rRNA pseudouridine1911/1915/1917 synthase|nr:RluA family pseudouridine synthase [Thermoguttaceae bacterium]
MPPARIHPDRLEVLYEDNHLLVLNKPAMLPTMGTPGGTETLLTLAKQYIKEKCSKPGNVYLGVVSRLDVPVSGVVLFARTSKAARRLTEQFRAGSVEKSYWALVEGRIEPAEKECVDWLAHDERHRRMRIAGQELPGAKQARLRYRKLQSGPAHTLVEVQLITGRKHQIRLQLAHQGFPILGDRKYGSRVPFSRGIALHARRLLVQHPVGGQPVEVAAPLPNYWPLAENDAAG